MVNLKNNILSVDIDTLGAEIKRITVNGEDRLWSGDPNVWEGTAPVLFPMCGGLRDDKFTHGGKEYHLAKHGFARKMNFEVESKTETAAVLLLKSNEETLKQFPWEFEFRVKFALDFGRITVIYDVKNLSDDTMYMSVGAHEAYACPDPSVTAQVNCDRTVGDHNIFIKRSRRKGYRTADGCGGVNCDLQ